LGGDVRAADIERLQAVGSIAVPADRSVGSYGTYSMPCRSFGLLDTGASGVPVRITPRGQTMHATRQELLSGSRLADIVMVGGSIDLPTIEAEGHLFSANGLESCEPERRLLEEAFREPYVEHHEVRQRYGRFLDTTRWALAEIDREPRSAAELIRLAYVKAIRSGSSDLVAVEVAWAEYEFRRMAHFALELLLSALTDTLLELTQGTLEDVVHRWVTDEPLPELVRATLPIDGRLDRVRLRDAAAALVDDSLVETPPDARRTGAELTAGPRALYALALLLSCARRSDSLRRSGRIPDRGDRDHVERALMVLRDRADDLISEILVTLLRRAVVAPHLATTLRKMGQGQQCSLRFFPEGEILRPVGTAVRAGYSGDRLGNVLGMWADTGMLRRSAGGRYELTDRGRRLLAELRR
jgi:hypothetical protein